MTYKVFQAIPSDINELIAGLSTEHWTPISITANGPYLYILAWKAELVEVSEEMRVKT